jgi:hypothetical protein
MKSIGIKLDTLEEFYDDDDDEIDNKKWNYKNNNK